MYLCQFFLSSIENIVCHNLRQHRTIPALRLKHRSGSCGTASALPKCSIMSGCGTRHRASGAKASRTLRPLPLLRFAVSATGGAHLCSIQYYLRFWLGICRTSLAVSALRIMRYYHNAFIDIFHLPNILIIPYFPLFPLKPKTSPFPAGFTRQRVRGCFLQIQTQSAITLHQAGSPATAGWPSTQWITFLGHLVTQVPQEEHLA